MLDLKWSDSEKKIARRAFDAALSRELSSLLESTKIALRRQQHLMTFGLCMICYRRREKKLTASMITATRN
jgi:hypothetical protein